MRLHTIVFAAMIAVIFGFSTTAHAQAAAQSQRVVPRFNNADLLALSDREQRVWVHGAVEGLANSIGLSNPTAGRCILTWYADGSARFAAVQKSAQQYPDHPPVAILVTLSNRRCSYYNPR